MMDINGWTATELAAALHISKAKISRALALTRHRAKMINGTA
jgi:plasmid maintenance system antidote protein VapI